jgi:hypothetical protein
MSPKIELGTCAVKQSIHLCLGARPLSDPQTFHSLTGEMMMLESYAGMPASCNSSMNSSLSTRPAHQFACQSAELTRVTIQIPGRTATTDSLYSRCPFQRARNQSVHPRNPKGGQ